MAGQGQLERLKASVSDWNNWRDANSDVEPDLQEADLQEANLEEANLNDTNLKGANLKGANLQQATLRVANAQGADLQETNLRDVDLHGANLQRADLRRADLHHANLNHANLEGANLEGANLSGATTMEANLRGANLLGISFDNNTKFPSPEEMVDCRVERFLVDTVKSKQDWRDLDLKSMKISDGVAQLRLSFSGVWRWIHLIALVTFLTPYVWFVLKNIWIANFSADEDSDRVYLFTALLHKMVTGGSVRLPQWWTWWSIYHCPLFLFSLSYNAGRGVLLWKTKKLEDEREVTGLPPQFSLTGGWRFLYRAVTIGFYINLLVVFLLTVFHMFTEIPIPT